MTSISNAPAAPVHRAVRPRRIRFDYAEQLERKHVHYCEDDLVMSHVVAMLSAMFPEGEDFFVRSVRHYADQITDPQLKEDVAGFIGQEVTHGREHRLLNQRLQDMGYPTARLDRWVKRDLAFVNKHLPRRFQLAVTAALEHYTASLAETLLSDPEAQARITDGEVKSMLLWHAIEESEHKAVAFDVYRAVGGTERQRIWTMHLVTSLFLLAAVGHSIASILADRSTYRRGVLWRSLRKLPGSPFLGPNVRRIREYNRVGFHPNDNDNSALLEEWSAKLFGEQGRLAENLR
ncbi:MAG TPA: metal-dependent hydrolase [Mycobacteriales bacterium]|nr:metal-dependent hydrolase [Mycobacteriales bacterium]